MTNEDDFVSKKLTEMLLMAAMKHRGEITEQEELEFIEKSRADIQAFIDFNDPSFSAFEELE